MWELILLQPSPVGVDGALQLGTSDPDYWRLSWKSVLSADRFPGSLSVARDRSK